MRKLQRTIKDLDMLKKMGLITQDEYEIFVEIHNNQIENKKDEKCILYDEGCSPRNNGKYEIDVENFERLSKITRII